MTVGLVAGAAATNPMTRGLWAASDTPLIQAIERLDDRGVRWANATSVPWISAAIAASGARSLTGPSTYPNVEMWRLVDPGETHRQEWNRFAHVFVAAMPAGSPTTFTLVQGDLIIVNLDLCGDDAAELQLGRAVVAADQPLPSCATTLETVPGPLGEEVVVAGLSPAGR